MADYTAQDFIESDKIVNELNRINEALLGVIKTGKEMGSSIKGADNVKTVREETEKLTQSQIELQKIEKQIATVQAKNNEEYIKAAKALEQNKRLLKEKTALGERDAKTVNAQNASEKQLRAALEKNREAYRNLANEEARASKEGLALKAIIDQQDQAVKKINADMGNFKDNVGNYEGAMKSLKAELKAAKDEMAFLAKNSGTTSAEFVKAAAKAGDLKDQINDLNDQIKITSGNKFEVLGNSLKDVGSKLLSLDFEGAANSAKQFAAVSKSLTLKEITAGLQSLGTTLANVGKALLTNPIFIIAGVIAGIALALKYFYDQQEKASQRQIKRYQNELDALTTRYDKEIKLQQIVGKNTFELEKAKQRAVIETADKQIKALGKVYEFDFWLSLASRSLQYKTNEEKIKQLADFTKAKAQAADELEIIEAQQAEFERKTAADTAKKIREDLFSLQQFRLKLAIEGEQEIFNNEKLSQDKRIAAIGKYVSLRKQLAQLEAKEALSVEGLTAEAILLIHEQLQANLTQALKDGQEARDKLREEEVKKIQDRLKGIGKASSDALEQSIKQYDKPIDNTIKGLAAKLGDGISKVTDTATFKLNEWKKNTLDTLDKIQQAFNTYFGAIANLSNSLSDRNIQNIELEKRALEDKHTRDIELAGDNKAQKEQIDKAYEAQKAKLDKKIVQEKQKQARLDKAIAIFNIGISTAKNIVEAFPNPVLIALAAALGAIQAAAVIAKPIPQYFKGARKGEHKGGPAWVGEQGAELMKKPGGDWELTPSVATLMDVPPSTEIVPHGETMRILARAALAQNGGTAQSKEQKHNEELLQEMKAVNRNLSKIKPTKTNLIRSGATVYHAIKDSEGHTKLVKGINLGRWF